MRAPRHLVSLLTAIVGAGYAVFVLESGSGYALHVLTVAGCFALLALGYQLVLGHAGALSLAQGSFMGIGAYASAVLATRFGLGFAAALPFSLGLPVILALLVGIPVLRLATHYFALATLILAQIALLVATQWESVTGGANGIAGIDPLANRWATLLLVWGAVALGAVLSARIVAGPNAAAFAVMRRDAVAAGSIGIDAGRLRLVAFVLGALYGGLAGSLYAHVIGVISPDILGLPVMVTCLTIVVVGGPRRIAGAIAGAVLVIELPEWFRGLREAYLLAYGAALLVAVIALPDGLVGAAEGLVARLLPVLPPSPPAPLPLPAIRVTRGEPLLVVERVTRDFGGVRALDGVSFAIAAGEIVGLIGPNGSGKSTLLNAITGIYPAASGRILFRQGEITHAFPHRIARLGIGRSFQTPSLVPDMTVLDAVAVTHGATRGQAMTLLAMTELAEMATRPCGALPEGARRRVEIARALALRPALLLLDEPAAGLGREERTDLAGRLRALARDGTALLVIEHDLGFLAGLAGRMLCLDAGRLIAEGTPDAVRADPRVIAAYLGMPG